MANAPQIPATAAGRVSKSDLQSTLNVMANTTATVQTAVTAETTRALAAEALLSGRITTAPPALIVPAASTATASSTSPLAGIIFIDAGATSTLPVYSFTITCVSGTLAGKDISGVALPGSGTKIVSGQATITALQKALSTLLYTAPASGTDTISVSITRSAGTVLSGTMAVTIQAAISPGTGNNGGFPSIAFPTTTLASTAGTPLAVTGVLISDPPAVTDGGAGTLTVACTLGTIAMSPNGVQIAGSGTTSIIMQASVTVANAALATLSYLGLTAGAAKITVAYTDSLGFNSPSVSISATVTGTVAPPVVLTPPTDPGVALPSLGIALNASYTFKNIYWLDSAAAANSGQGAAAITATSGTFAITMSGSATKRVGFTNKNTVFDGNYADIAASIASLTYTAPASGTTDTMTVDFFSPVDGVDRGGNIAITLRAGATVESGGYNPAQSGGGPIGNTGVARIADMLERIGFNTFSAYNEQNPGIVGNTWGSKIGDYNPSKVIAIHAWLVGSSGIILRFREYHYDGFPYDTYQAPWMQLVHNATGAHFKVCIGSNAPAIGNLLTIIVIPLKTAGLHGEPVVDQVESLNEPNLNGIPIASTLTAQQAIFAAVATIPGVTTIQSSIVVGLPNIDGYITGYTGASNAALNAAASANNLHFYPPTLPDLDDGVPRKGALGDFVQGALNVFPTNKPLHLSEIHSTLFNSAGNGLGAGTNTTGLLDAYYWISILISGFTNYNIAGFDWFSLLDYDTTMLSGMFQIDVNTPRPVAYATRALIQLTGDTGTTKHTFTPAAFAYTVSPGIAPISSASPFTGLQIRVFRNSAGTIFMFVGNVQVAPGGSPSNQTITFTGGAVSSVTEYDLTTNPVNAMTPVQTHTSVSSIVIALTASWRLVVITP